MIALPLVQVGDDLAVILPEAVVTRLMPSAGDDVKLDEVPGGFTLTACPRASEARPSPGAQAPSQTPPMR